MAELSYEQNIRYENSKAHYHKIMGDVNDANNAITRLLSIKEDVENKIRLLELELNTLVADKQKILEAHQQDLNQVIAATQHRFEEVDNLEAEKAFIERTHKARVMELTTSTYNLEAEERKLKDSLSTLTKAVKNASAELTEVEREVDMAEAELEVITDQLIDVREDLSETTMLIDDTRDNFHRDYNQKLKELETLKNEIESARASVEAPFRNLQERTEAHAKRMKDFNVIYNRMKRIYAEMYPGQTLTI